VSKLIGDIYEASYKPDHRPAALEAVAAYTDSSSAALLYQDNEPERTSGSHVYNIPREHLAQYSSIRGGDPDFRIMAPETPPGVAAAIDPIVPDREALEKSDG